VLDPGLSHAAVELVTGYGLEFGLLSGITSLAVMGTGGRMGRVGPGRGGEELVRARGGQGEVGLVGSAFMARRSQACLQLAGSKAEVEQCSARAAKPTRSRFCTARLRAPAAAGPWLLLCKAGVTPRS